MFYYFLKEMDILEKMCIKVLFLLFKKLLENKIVRINFWYLLNN